MKNWIGWRDPEHDTEILEMEEAPQISDSKITPGDK
jgi:hypothetical protein